MVSNLGRLSYNKGKRINLLSVLLCTTQFLDYILDSERGGWGNVPISYRPVKAHTYFLHHQGNHASSLHRVIASCLGFTGSVKARNLGSLPLS